MAKLAQCPDPNELRLLAAGELRGPQLDALTRHLEACPACLARVQTIAPADTLVESLSKARALPEGPDAAVVGRLVGKLKQLPLAPAGGLLSFPCPQCKKTLRTKPEMAGKKSKCPGCGTPVVVPGNPVAATRGPSQTVTVPPAGAAPEADATDAAEAWDFLAPAQSQDEIGRLGPYRILQVLGRGGMGVVFRAEDPNLQRLVALKAMLPSLAASPSAKKRFLREAQTAARLKHDHIVTIHQVGEDRGAPYLAMEFLHGEPLDARQKRQGKLPPAEVLRIGREVAEGLAAAHDAGLIHRDIKPANIWLESAPAGRTRSEGASASTRRAERVKILDFGLARATDDQAGLTQSGAIMGTPAYMAPEQAQGKPVDGRCDLFSLGCVLYVMTTGRLPFQGTDTISTLMAIATEPAKPPSELDPSVSRELSDFIMKLLAKDPAQRPASAHEVATHLEALEAGRGSTSLPTPPPRASWALRPRSRRGLLIAGALAAACVALLAATVFFIQTPNGTVRIEINDPDVEVVLSKGGAVIKGADKKHEISLTPGEHGLRVKRGDFEFETNKFVLHKGETITLKVEFLKGNAVVTRADGTVVGQKEVPGAAPPVAAGSPYELLFTTHGSITVPTLKLDKPGPLTLEATFTPHLGKSRGVDFYAGCRDGLHMRTFSATRMSVRWGEQLTHPLHFVPSPDARVDLAAVYTGKELLCFQDGKLLDRGDASKLDPKNVKNAFVIANEFSGRMHQVRVSRGARYSADYTPSRFTADKDTLALYLFDEGKGDQLRDASGNNHHGKIDGGTWVKSFHAPGWTPTLDQVVYLDAVSKLPAQERVAAVTRKLNEVNAALEFPKVAPVFEPKDGEPTSCRLGERHVYQIWPLAALPKLTTLDVAAGSVVDFKPLTRLPLTELKTGLVLDNVKSEQALKGLSTLKTINGTPAATFWADRAALRGDIENFARTGQSLALPDRMAWFGPVIKKLNPKCTATFVGGKEPDRNQMGLWMADGLTHFSARAIEGDVFDLSPLRALGADTVHLAAGKFYDLTPLTGTKTQSLTLQNHLVRDLSPLAGLRLKEVNCPQTPVADLTPLAGMPLEALHCYGTEVADISVLHGMPLVTLNIDNTRVSNLGPLAGMKLKRLYVPTHPHIIDLAPVKDMPLEILHIGRVPDLSVLKGMPLQELYFHPRRYFDADDQLIRSLPLQKINGRAPAEFWKDLSAQRQADANAIATLVKAPLDEKTMKAALSDAAKRDVQKVTIADGAVVAVEFGDRIPSFDNLGPLRAFPKLRKLVLQIAPCDFSPLLALPLLEELECQPGAIAYNLPVLRAMPNLKTINGKPAREFVKP